MESNKTRLAVLAAAVVIAGVLFVVLSDNDEDQGAPSTAAETSESVDRTSGGGQQGGAHDATKPVPTITVKGGQPQGGIQEVTAQSGEEVRFRVVSDGSAEVHVHGYDLETEVTAERPAILRFPAEIEGRFEIELHLPDGTEVEIGELSVTPS